MDEMAVSRFKATCLAELERIRRTGRSLLLTKHGKPIAVVGPPPPSARGGSTRGCAKDLMVHLGDVVTPLTLEEWGLEP